MTPESCNPNYLGHKQILLIEIVVDRLGGQAVQKGLTVFSIPSRNTYLRLHHWLIVKYGQIVSNPVGCPQSQYLGEGQV